jgi:alkaline phosphatase
MMVLMVESASIDKQAHYRKTCGSIGELQQLNDALDSAMNYAQKHPDTLILVTADHGHAAQIVPDASLFASSPYPIYRPGRLSRIITPQGNIMAVNYGTSDFFTEEHTGVSVPLMANKVALGRLPSMISQPQVFNIVRDYLIEED